LNDDIREKIQKLLNSQVITYLETSERLILKNTSEKENISQLEIENLDKILTKYEKFFKN
tara:strand:- start:23 stop:202 length:180 start_codon:yes stop_codon:yes gene_type:complete